jgi:cytochrome P450
MHPKNPILAVCHPDPYPYYQGLLAEPALYFDAELKLWIACRAEVIDEIFANPHCAVRPGIEPVPKAIVASSAGDVFSHLIRMNEGRKHEGPKLALDLALSSLDLSSIALRSRYFAAVLGHKRASNDGVALNTWMFELPVYVVGDLLGFSEDELPKLALWMTDFVRCLSPLSTPVQLTAASNAADSLLEGFRQMLVSESVQDASLLSRIMHEAKLVGWDNLDAILANLIGLLSQTYEATAGLIGNCVVTLITQPHLHVDVDVDADAGKINSFVEEVTRFDPPVQNTRRFVNQTTHIAGVELQAGDAIILVLAAASRDPLANPAPNDFILARTNRRVFGFGHGRHACPGQKLACSITAAAMEYLLESERTMSRDARQWTYRPSLNGRIPVFSNIDKRT